MRCIIVRYEIFQNLIAHFQSTLYELGDQIESLLDDQQREEIGNLMDRSDQLIHQALAQANRDDVTYWKERLERLRKCML